MSNPASNQAGTPPTTKNTRTPDQVQAQQRADAAAHQAKQRPVSPPVPQPKPPQVSAPTPAATITTAMATDMSADNREYRQRYLDEVAPATFPGRFVKFAKEGKFVIAETGEEISPDTDFVALCDETLCGWIKFSAEEDVPPERHQGLLYDNFVMPPRESLGDLDPAQWPLGLSGAPEDPHRHQMVLVLQDRASLELYSFGTTSKSGRRAIGTLLRHFDRLLKSHPGAYPIVRLRASGFMHKDPRISWVSTPSFAVVGRAPKADAAVPDSSPAADLNDEVPF